MEGYLPPSLSLLLLLFALSSLLALLGEELALCLEPDPATLDVSRGIVHRHLLLHFGSLFLSVDLELFLALHALFVVDVDHLVQVVNLFLGLNLSFLNVSTLSANAIDFVFTFRLLLLELCSQLGHSFLQVLHYGRVDFLLCGESFPRLVDLFLDFIFLLGVDAVFARLLSLDDHVHVLNVQVLLDLGLVFLSLQLRHFLVVFFLFARKLVLQSLVLG